MTPQEGQHSSPAERLAVDLRQVLWSVQPYKTMPCWAQARAYSRRTAQGHLCPRAHVHSVLSHRATKGSGSTRGWQRANTEALFRSWHCSHGPCRNETALGEDGGHAAQAPQGTGLCLPECGSMTSPPCPESQGSSLTLARVGADQVLILNSLSSPRANIEPMLQEVDGQRLKLPPRPASEQQRRVRGEGQGGPRKARSRGCRAEPGGEECPAASAPH